MTGKRFIDDFAVDDLVHALREMRITDKARTMLHALATAPNRALSRYEIARSIRSESPQSCNTCLGPFARNLAHVLDSALAEEWKPTDRVAGGDWVMFVNHGIDRWTPPSSGEVDEWVFVMRENLARALDVAGIAPYSALDLVGVSETSSDDWMAADDGESSESQEYDEPTSPLQDIEAATYELNECDETAREALILARLGQGGFRDQLLDSWDHCCSVSGSAFTPALVASHIKPWRDCTNIERLDTANGLLLIGSLDRLFDSGFITFADDGRIMISPCIPAEEYDALGLSKNLQLRRVANESRSYLEFHRSSCFVDTNDDEYEVRVIRSTVPSGRDSASFAVRLR